MSATGRVYQDPLETWSEKANRKFKENPWVPIGCLATCGALVMSAIKMRQGQSKNMNYWLRARVVLQGLTLAVLVAGSMSIQKSRNKEIANAGIGEAEGGLPRNEATTELLLEKRKEKEKLEFEERLREAQEATEMEESAGLSGMKTVKGPTVHKERREEERRKHDAAARQGAGSTIGAVKKSNSWRWWSKGSSGSGSQEGGDSS
ncbi:hypoxia induced protein conserved region-domain-containing protein [Flammula alnicola]|nr:hypoxia induced protein conserved region-domain-containing protein [Flammula alnicola]